MVLSFSILLMYIIMIALGVQAIFVFIIFKRMNLANINKPALVSGKNFLITTLLLGLLYFITFFSDEVLQSYETSFIYRLFDGMIFYALGLSFIKVLESYLDKSCKKVSKLSNITNFLFAILMVASSLSYGFLLDEYYQTSNFLSDVVIIGLEIFLIFIVLIFSIIFYQKMKSENSDTSITRLLLTIGVLVNICNIWNSSVVLSIFVDIYTVSVLITYSYSLTAFFIVFLNLFTFRYLYLIGDLKNLAKRITVVNEPVLSTEVNESVNLLSNEDKLSLVIKKYHITDREKDVLTLAYQGLTNPEIGEVLFISKHTVKKHMHNIFEKMEVTSRMELVHTVNNINEAP